MKDIANNILLDIGAGIFGSLCLGVFIVFGSLFFSWVREAWKKGRKQKIKIK